MLRQIIGIFLHLAERDIFLQAVAANGVIIITTKRGKTEEVSVNYHGSVSFENPLVKYDMVDGGEWMDIMRIAYMYNLPAPNFDRAFLSGMHSNCWESVEMG